MQQADEAVQATEVQVDDQAVQAQPDDPVFQADKVPRVLWVMPVQPVNQAKPVLQVRTVLEARRASQALLAETVNQALTDFQALQVSKVSLVQPVHAVATALAVDQVPRAQTVSSSNLAVRLATKVLPVLEVTPVQPVRWADKVDKVLTALQVLQVQTDDQVPLVHEVDQVLTADQVSKAELVHQVLPVLQVLLVQPVQLAASTRCTDLSTLDIVKSEASHLALLATLNSGLVTLFSTPPVTADLLPKTLVLPVLACEALPLCHSCTATLTNNVTLPPETTSLTGCLLPRLCQ